MKPQPATRIGKVEEYYFSKKLTEVNKLIDQGKPIINLGIGNPDLPTHSEVIEELNHASQEKGSNYYQSYRTYSEPAEEQAEPVGALGWLRTSVKSINSKIGRAS